MATDRKFASIADALEAALWAAFEEAEHTGEAVPVLITGEWAFLGGGTRTLYVFPDGSVADGYES